jgi:hypothetical protein
MAQETAGTIGIPVLKNEVLPYLTDYAKRQERAQLYKQKAEQRAAELAAKKAAEDAKFVPEFQAGLGSDMWEHVDRAKNEADIQRGLALAKDQSVPRQQVSTVSNEINRAVSQRSNISKQLKESTLKTAEDLRKRGWLSGPEYAYQWAKQQQDYKSPEEFSKAVRSNPDLIDFETIGKKGKEYRVEQYSYRGPKGETRQIAISPLFEYKMEKDPVIGAEVPVVTGVNGVEAQKLIESDQDMKEAFQVFVKNKGEKYKNQTFVDPGTGSPIMLRPEIAEQKAAEEFMENAFGKYGKVKYGQSFQMPRKGGAGGGASEQFTMSIATPAGMGSHEFEVESLSGSGANIKGVPQSQIGDVGGKDDTVYPYEKEYIHPANKKVRLLQKYNKDTFPDYLEETPDGQYLLKAGFNYANPTKRTLYFADEDIYLGGDKTRPYIRNGVRQNWTRIRKGREIPPATAERLMAEAKQAGRKSGVVKEIGYEITANMYTGEEGDVAKRPTVKMFIPEANAGEIKKHIEMEQQKKRRKRGPETVVDSFQGGEVDLGY